MLTLYGEMFLSEYTLYDLNDELDCASTENVIEIQTTNPDYSGTDNLSLCRQWFEKSFAFYLEIKVFRQKISSDKKVSVSSKKVTYSKILLIIGSSIPS